MSKAKPRQTHKSDIVLRIAHLQATLREFRDFVIDRAKVWDVSKGPANHHNPIWQRVAEAITPRGLPRFTHHKRPGDHFLVLAGVEVQSARPIQEGDKLTIYLSEDGKPWARLDDEFNDGRFKRVNGT